MGKYKWSIMFFVLAVSYGVYKSFDEEKSLESNFGVNKGVIIEVETYRRSGQRIFIKFESRINNKIITSNTAFTCDESHVKDFRKGLIGKTLDIVYEKGDPANCKMLLNKDEYKRFKIMPSKESVLVLDYIEVVCASQS